MEDAERRDNFVASLRLWISGRVIVGQDDGATIRLFGLLAQLAVFLARNVRFLFSFERRQRSILLARAANDKGRTLVVRRISKPLLLRADSIRLRWFYCVAIDSAFDKTYAKRLASIC